MQRGDEDLRPPLGEFLPYDVIGLTSDQLLLSNHQFIDLSISSSVCVHSGASVH